MTEGHRLLIVEDDVDVSEMLRAYFNVQGYEVLTAAWGEDAVQTSLNDSPDLIILDIRLPDIDGYEVAQRLRKDRHTNTIPIVFLTEKREREDKLKGLELGADDYITKPFDIQELRLRVRNSLRRSDQPPLINPVTGLPESELVDEHLQECIQSNSGNFLVIRIDGISEFKNKYGFLAADDALRAISLMIQNAVKQVDEGEYFLGHLSMSMLLVSTSDAAHLQLDQDLQPRLTQSLIYFYPLRDRPDPSIPPEDGSLSIHSSRLSLNSAHAANLEELKADLLRAISV